MIYKAFLNFIVTISGNPGYIQGSSIAAGISASETVGLTALVIADFIPGVDLATLPITAAVAAAGTGATVLASNAEAKQAGQYYDNTVGLGERQLEPSEITGTNFSPFGDQAGGVGYLFQYNPDKTSYVNLDTSNKHDMGIMAQSLLTNSPTWDPKGEATLWETMFGRSLHPLLDKVDNPYTLRSQLETQASQDPQVRSLLSDELLNDRLPLLYRDDPIYKTLSSLRQRPTQEYRSNSYLSKQELLGAKPLQNPGIVSQNAWANFSTAADVEKLINRTSQWDEQDRLPLLENALKKSLIWNPQENAKLVLDISNPKKVRMSPKELQDLTNWAGGSAKFKHMQNSLTDYLSLEKISESDMKKISSAFNATRGGDTVASAVFGPAAGQSGKTGQPAVKKPAAKAKPKKFTVKRSSLSQAGALAGQSLGMFMPDHDQIAGMIALSLQQVFANMPKAAGRKGM